MALIFAIGLLSLLLLIGLAPDESRRTAKVKCSAMATGATVNGDFYREGRLIYAELVRCDDGEWRFSLLRADPVVSFE